MKIEITEYAAEEGKKLVGYLQERDNENTVVGVYIGIIGGGCAGFQYDVHPMLEKDTADEESYLKFEKDGFVVYTDNISIMHLDGVIIDWQTTGTGSSMLIRNPNQHTTCGCGNSFS